MASRLVLAAFVAVMGLLVWDHVQAADPPATHIESRQITVHATHDTLHIEWNTGYPAEEYSVDIYKDYEYWNYSGFLLGPSWKYVVGPEAPFELTVSGLDPDTIYVVEVYAGDWRDSRPGVVVVRTESVPDKWWDEHIARNLKTGVYGNTLFVVWDCLELPYVEQLVIEIKEYGAPQRTAQRRSVSCTTNSMLSDPIQQGTAYEVTIFPVDMEDYQRKLIEKIPSSIPDTRYMVDETPSWETSVEHSDDIRGWEFTVSVDAARNGNLFEVEWIRDGYRMTRVGRGPTFVYHSDSAGPFPFRVRSVTSRGGVSQWSPSRFASVEPQSPSRFGIRYQLRGSDLYVAWPPGHHPAGIDRVFALLAGARVPLQVVDTGKLTHAVFAIDPHVSRYEFLVGAYREDVGLGEFTRIEIDLERPPELTLSAEWRQPFCLLASGTPMRGFWTVAYGLPPYRVTVGTQDPVTSVLPHGAFESGCTTTEGEWSDEGGLLTHVRVKVEDGLGRQMEGSLTYKIRGRGEPGASQVQVVNRPSPVPVQVSEAIVGSTGLSVVFEDRNAEAQYLLSRVVIRWRTPSHRDWKYEREDVSVRLTRYATVMWRNLTPNTSLEFQVAVDYLGMQAEEIPEEAWSSLQQVRTRPGEIIPDVSRVGTSVVVRWENWSNKWGYSVAVRSEGEGWWKAHEPNGTGTECVVFEGIPADATIEVEVMTPPIGAPQWWSYFG